MSETPLLPSVILVRPQMGENIGAAARAMMNFGLTDLRLVAPRDGWPNPKAHEMAAHADFIIERAQVFETFEDAVADCHAIYATSARIRQFTMPVFSPEAVVSEMAARTHQGERTAFVFGPERSGLLNEEVARCTGLVNIATHPDNASLNIAQSVVILCYQWWQAWDRPEAYQQELKKSELPASLQEIESFYGHLSERLEEGGFFHHSERSDAARRNLRLMLARFPLTSGDCQMWHGIIRALTK